MKTPLALALLLAVGCASVNTSGPARAPGWSDFENAVAAVRCAVRAVDGQIKAARILDGVTFEVRDPYPLAGHYQPMETGGALITLWGGADSAWHSALRYELLCRRRAHIEEGDPRKCTPERWEGEIKARYGHDLRRCFFGGIR